MLINHCEVARNITGVLWRQQCGKLCRYGAWCTRRPRSSSLAMMTGPAASTLRPATSSVPGTKRPSGPTGLIDRQPVAAADREVLLTVRRRGMHRAGAGLEGDVIAENHRHLLGEPGVLELQPFERRAAAAAEDLAFQPIARQAGRDQLVGEYQDFRAAQRLARARSRTRSPPAPPPPRWPAASTGWWSRSPRTPGAIRSPARRS